MFRGRDPGPPLTGEGSVGEEREGKGAREGRARRDKRV